MLSFRVKSTLAIAIFLALMVLAITAFGTVIASAGSIAYVFPGENGTSQIQVVRKGIFSPGIGPEGVRIWKSRSFSFQIKRGASGIQTVLNPLINGDEIVYGNIVVSFEKMEVCVLFDKGPRSSENGTYKLSEYSTSR